MLVGEQPGDREDSEGKPFVGPAGLLLDQCLTEAGIHREEAYVTNAVKHFKWEPRGKRRIHKKPSAREMAACRPWLDAEIRAIHPALIVCLGATAAQALLGGSFRVTHDHGKVMSITGLPPVLATVHPSSILRSPDHESREQARAGFIDDLGNAASFLRHHRSAA
jgi:DNA polymerase